MLGKEYSKKTIKARGKELIINSSGNLTKNGLLNLFIEVNVGDKRFILTDKNHNFSLEGFKILIEFLEEKKIEFRNAGTKDEALKTLKNRFYIYDKDQNILEFKGFNFTKMNNRYLTGEAYSYDKEVMGLIEVFNTKENLSLIENKLEEMLN